MKLVAYYRQEAGHTCGPAALRMLLEHKGVRRSEAALARALRTNIRRGTNRANLASLPRSLGLGVCVGSMTMGELRHVVRRGEPVLVNYVEPTEEVGHFALVTGCTGTHITLADPWNGDDFLLPVRAFARRWLGYKSRNTSKGWGMWIYEV